MLPPRNYSVNLREELRITSAVFFPRCLLVKRCGGNCGCGTDNWNSGCTCQAAKTTQKLHEVGLRSRIKDCPVHSGCSVSFYLNRCPAPFSATRLIEECLTNKLCHSYKTPTDLLSQESSQSLQSQKTWRGVWKAQSMMVRLIKQPLSSFISRSFIKKNKNIKKTARGFCVGLYRQHTRSLHNVTKQ